MDDYNLLELLAEYEHNRWSRWQKFLHEKCIINNDGTLTIPKELVDRWERQLATKYNDLSEEDKDKDRKEAIRIMEIYDNRK